jgi:hypothetical protein
MDDFLTIVSLVSAGYIYESLYKKLVIARKDLSRALQELAPFENQVEAPVEQPAYRTYRNRSIECQRLTTWMYMTLGFILYNTVSILIAVAKGTAH